MITTGEIAIRAQGLSKQFRIGAKQEKYRTLRDTLAGAAAGPFRRARAVFQHDKRQRSSNTTNFWALRDVSFEVKRGEVVGVIGRNGAGKSTLLKVLSRVTEPTEGRAEIYGRVGALLEVGTGFHQELTGRENIYLNGAILGMKREEIRRKFDEIVDFAEVEQFVDTPVKHYSSGMFLRLAFSVAAHLEPDILLVDEVLAVGDLAFQRKCLGKMEDVASQGRTVLFVSHNLGAVKELCQSSIVLDKGQIEFRGPAVQGVTRYAQDMLVGEDGSEVTGTGWRQVRISGGPADAMGPLSNGEPFAAEANLDLGCDYRKTRLYCIVDNSNGNGVVHHFIDSRNLAGGSSEDGLRAGRYHVRAEFPPLWLVPDAYTLYFKVIGQADSGMEERHLSERILLDVTDRTGQMDGKVHAAIIPPVTWSISPE